MCQPLHHLDHAQLVIAAGRQICHLGIRRNNHAGVAALAAVTGARRGDTWVARAAAAAPSCATTRKPTIATIARRYGIRLRERIAVVRPAPSSTLAVVHGVTICAGGTIPRYQTRAASTARSTRTSVLIGGSGHPSPVASITKI